MARHGNPPLTQSPHLIVDGYTTRVVAKVVAKVVEKIGQKASVVVDFGDNLQELKQKLNELNALLTDADKKSSPQQFPTTMMLWIGHLQAAALDSADLLLCAAGSVSPSLDFRKFKNLFNSYRIGSEIRKTNANIDGLKQNYEQDAYSLWPTTRLLQHVYSFLNSKRKYQIFIWLGISQT